jgi:undecaprenyl-diphosphatase
VLGIVQGLTEFLPISSTGHVRIVSALFGWEDPGAAFTAVTQLGTLTAVLLYFRKDIATITFAWVRSLVQPEYRGNHDARMGWYVILGTIPVGVLGFAFRHQIKEQARDLRIIAAAMIGVALVLWAADRIGRRDKELRQLDVRDGLVYGLAQATALIPGVSRSGATISAGLFLGYTREAATRYSFLLSIPAVLASGLFELLDIGSDKNAQWGPTIVATVIAGVVGYAVIAWLLRYVATHNFLPFVIYRLAVGVMLVVLLATGAVTAVDRSGRRLQPAAALERPVQGRADDRHGSDREGVPEPPVQLGHVVEVHAVDAGDHGRHRQDRDPRRDLAHVLVLTQPDLGHVRLQDPGQQPLQRLHLLLDP